MDNKSLRKPSDDAEQFDIKDFAVGVAKSFVSDFMHAASATPKQMLSLITAGPVSVWSDMKKHADESPSATCEASSPAKKAADDGKDKNHSRKQHPTPHHG